MLGVQNIYFLPLIYYTTWCITVSTSTRIFIGRIKVKTFGRIGRIKGVNVKSSR